MVFFGILLFSILVKSVYITFKEDGLQLSVKYVEKVGAEREGFFSGIACHWQEFGTVATRMIIIGDR